MSKSGSHASVFGQVQKLLFLFQKPHFETITLDLMNCLAKLPEGKQKIQKYQII